MDRSNIVDLFDATKNMFGCNYNLKEKQIDCVQKLMCGENVICVLPTGFGKSECFILPPIFHEEMTGLRKIAIVVSPLKSLMKDMTRRLNERNISAGCIFKAEDMDPDTTNRLEAGDYRIVFVSPEIIIHSRWREVIRNKIYKERLCLLACDEAHCILEWGDSFRPAYRELGVLRSLLDVPLLVMTATLTTDMKDKIVDIFDLTSYHTTKYIFKLQEVFRSAFQQELEWLLQLIVTKKRECAKTIIYCNTITAVGDLYVLLADHLICNNISDNLVQEYHSEVCAETGEFILDDFARSDGETRVLVATVAFGMGISVPNIRNVIHWGASRSILSYWQEVGRAGRDGEESTAFFYCTRLDPRHLSADMVKFCKDLTSESECVRLKVLQHLALPEIDDGQFQVLREKPFCGLKCNNCCCSYCKCCSKCREKCPCQI